MRPTTFAAVYIGNYDVTLEIFEISKKYGVNRIDRIRKHLEIGTDTYATGLVSNARVNELCSILSDFVRISEEYQVESIRAVAASSVREAENNLFVIGRIRQITGLQVEILTNSEQRFLSYKAIYSSDVRFRDQFERGTVVIDIGGGSIQISIFENGKICSTLNLRIGSLRIRDRLLPIRAVNADYEKLVEEYIAHQLHTFRTVYLKGRSFDSVILNGDFITETLFRDIEARQSHAVSRKKFDSWYEQILSSSDQDLATKLQIPAEFAPLLRPTAILYHKFVNEIGASRVFACGVTLSLGMAYDYAEDTRRFRQVHDFDEDVLASAGRLADRFQIEWAHVNNVTVTALEIFSAVRKIHGMKNRDRLLLQVAAMLHEVGKYISLTNSGNNSYNIIMNNEIIGLTHDERELTALTVRHNTCWLPEYEKFARQFNIDQKRYQRLAQLTAILRMANELDRSHMQKIQRVRAVYKENVLTLRLEVDRPFDLEENLVRNQISFFNEVFCIDTRLRIVRIS